ncbi:hypothetical protein [Allomuricauda sp. CP2A]|jgi:hypothetical protein|uniref:hypothetical protein n=1 Tax=Allomuricauda sp. CP2A TaxID=1848189 RepID=UPI00159EC4BD|nr:hypothetical protein [Muricauda sp. CP2A]
MKIKEILTAIPFNDWVSVLFRNRIKSTPEVSSHNTNYYDSGNQADYYCDENGWFI